MIIGEPWEIVGVVGDVKQYNLARATVPEVYVPHEQWSQRTMQMVLSASVDPLLLASAIRREVHSLDSDIPVERFEPLEQVIADSVAQPRFYMTRIGISNAIFPLCFR